MKRTLNILLNLGRSASDGRLALMFIIDAAAPMTASMLSAVCDAVSALAGEKAEQDLFGAIITGAHKATTVELSEHSDYFVECLAGVKQEGDVADVLGLVVEGISQLEEKQDSRRHLIVITADPVREAPATEPGGGPSTCAHDCIAIASRSRATIHVVRLNSPEAGGGEVWGCLAKKTGGRMEDVSSADLSSALRRVWEACCEADGADIAQRLQMRLQRSEAATGVNARLLTIENVTGNAGADLHAQSSSGASVRFGASSEGAPREMHHDFREALLTAKAGNAMVLRDVLLKLLVDQVNGMVGGGMGGVAVFVCGRLDDLLTLSAAIVIAREVRAVRAENTALFQGGLVLTGVFQLHEEMHWTSSDKARLHAFLQDLSQEQGRPGGRLFDRCIIVSGNNSHPGANPHGFVNLTSEQSADQLVELLTGLNLTPELSALALTGAGPLTELTYASIGEVSLFADYEDAIARSAEAFTCDLLYHWPRLSADGARAGEQVENIVQEHPVTVEALEDRLIRLGDEQGNAIGLLTFDLGRYWPFVGEVRKGYVHRQDYLTHLPSDLREYGEFLLREKLRDFTAAVRENASHAVGDFKSAVVRDVDRELAGAPAAHPRQAKEYLARLARRLKEEMAGLQRQERLRISQFKASIENLPSSDRPRSTEEAYRDLVEQVAKMPVTEAIYARYIFLALIVFFAVGQAIVLFPDLLLNLGPFQNPYLLGGLASFIVFALGVLKHRLADRQLDYFIKYYAMALEKQVREEAVGFLRQAMEGVYTQWLAHVGDPDRDGDPGEGSELAVVEKLNRYLAEKGAVPERRAAAGESLFHLSVFEQAPGEGDNSLPITLQPPVVGYRRGESMNWRNEVELARAQYLLDDWRRIAVVPSVGGLDEWIESRRARLRFARDTAAYARARFAVQFQTGLKLMKLLQPNNEKHNRRLWDRLKALFHSPIYSSAPRPLLRFFWSSSADDLRLNAEAKILPELTKDHWHHMLSDDASHIRFFSLMTFAPDEIPFFVQCRTAYEQESDKSALHTQNPESRLSEESAASTDKSELDDGIL
ncbi:MAG: hypothetical protein KIT57_10460 [Blastocatellales bacterium]|nr:hypothetical protein [Blastocatellales bacterium]